MLLMLSLLLASGPHKGETAEAASPDAAAASIVTQSVPATDKPGKKTAEQDAQRTLDLALKTINLSQGEGGIELWRLKAEWASMQKEDGRIAVQQPVLTYFMPEKDHPLLVTSDKGLIDQKEQVLQFIDDVLISQADKSMRGKLLVYNGTVKTMTFPQGGKFTGTGVSGEAAFLVWDMKSKTIRAEEGVSVHFAGSESSGPVSPEQGQ